MTADWRYMTNDDLEKLAHIVAGKMRRACAAAEFGGTDGYDDWSVSHDRVVRASLDEFNAGRKLGEREDKG